MPTYEKAIATLMRVYGLRPPEIAELSAHQFVFLLESIAEDAEREAAAMSGKSAKPVEKRYAVSDSKSAKRVLASLAAKGLAGNNIETI